MKMEIEALGKGSESDGGGKEAVKGSSDVGWF